MKIRLARLPRILLPALALGAFSIDFAHGFSSTPPVNRTGAPGSPPILTCAQCHTGSGSGSVTIDFEGVSEYEPGGDYTMMVTVADPAKVRWGFSMVARDADNDTVDVGTWTASGASTQVYGTGGSHVGHQSAPLTPGVHTFTFEVSWKAPATGVGDITFYFVGNAADGLGNSGGGDNVYADTLTISEAVPANMAPSFTVPGGTLNVTTGLESAIAGISIDDPDSGAGDLTVTLSVDQGILHIDDSVAGGVGAGGISGNGSSNVTMTGTLAELNATFSGSGALVYQSDTGYLGAETLELTADDNGNTGSGGAQMGNASISISVNAPPSLSDLAHLGVGGFQFTLNGVSGLTYTVEYSEDLQTWQFLEEVTLASGSAIITDAAAANSSRRFYRAREGTQ